MKHHYFKRPLSYIGWGGKGKQVRDLLHIDDLCELLSLQISNMSNGNGKVYNVGGGEKVSLSLLETTLLCQEITGNKLKINSRKENRPFDLPVYITDNSKISRDYHWAPKRSKEKIMEDIYEWLKQTGEDWV